MSPRRPCLRRECLLRCEIKSSLLWFLRAPSAGHLQGLVTMEVIVSPTENLERLEFLRDSLWAIPKPISWLSLSFLTLSPHRVSLPLAGLWCPFVGFWCPFAGHLQGQAQGPWRTSHRDLKGHTNVGLTVGHF